MKNGGFYKAMDPDAGSFILFLIFLFLGSVVVLCQNAIIAIPDSRIKKGDSEEKNQQLVERMLRSPSRFSSGMRTAYTFFHLCAVAFLSRFFVSLQLLPEQYRGTPWGQGVEALVSMLVGTLFILIFSRGVPRRIGAQSAEQLAYSLAPLARLFLILFTPLRIIIDWAVGGLCALLGAEYREGQENVTEEDIRMLMDVSEESGGINQRERDMINNVFEFDDRTANEIMTHRTDVKFLEEDATLAEAVGLSVQFGFSRIPVVGEDLDDVKGILNVKDLLPLILTDPGTPFSLKDYMREAVFVPESTRCRDLFSHLSAKKVQIAVVVDEYGGTSGIVTMEDLLESIVGNIQDEYDQEEEEATCVAPDTYTLDGDIDLSEVERLLGCDLDQYREEDYETLGGLLIGLLDRIPEPGEHPSVMIDDITFTVMEANERQILKVAAKKQPEPEEQTQPDEKDKKRR